jgi:membrane protease YdiL (CAAX protease family)
VTPEISIEREPSWGYTDLVVFTFLSLMSIVFCQLAVHGLVVLFHGDPHNDGAFLLPTQVLLYALLFGILGAIIKLQYGRGFWRSLGWKESSVGLGAAALLGFALALLMAWLGAVLHTPDVDTPVKHLLARRSTAIEFAIVATTLGPLCEELIFRGFLQPVLVRSLGAAIGILLTGASFGALHLVQYGFAWQAGALITIAGMAFGWMRQLTGSTRASTCMHAAYNGCFFILLFANGTHFR